MLFALSGLAGTTVEATDGRAGTVKDVLFDDASWRVRWIVIDTGTWLPGRKILIHPSAVGPLDFGTPSGDRLPMMGGRDALALPVRLTQRQIEDSPDIREHEPVSEQVQSLVYDYFGWDRHGGLAEPGMNAIASPLSAPPLFGAVPMAEPERQPPHGEDDPHLQSVAAVIGCHIHASDGDIGHVENLLADDGAWDIRYLVVATSNWWIGKKVLLAPFAVRDIDWSERQVTVNVTREQVRSSPPWDPAAAVDRIKEEQLHRHYGWPGYPGT
jgi:hypothetical protein